jgi:hypothetical protein
VSTVLRWTSFGGNIWIEQPNDGIDMRQVWALLRQLLLKSTQRSGQFCSLLPQCTNDMRLGSCNPLLQYPRPFTVEQPNLYATSRWWRFLHDAAKDGCNVLNQMTGLCMRVSARTR